jgi:hypothetical protein
MERDHLVRNDFPRAHGTEGFDVDSVGAHLAAVAAHVAALEARITALEVEREALRRQLADAREHQDGPSGLPEPGPDPLDTLGSEVEKAPVEQLPADPEPDEAAGAAPGEDEVAARLLASKLAMEGKGRDTIVMQLAAEHEVDDPGALVDDVLAHLA